MTQHASPLRPVRAHLPLLLILALAAVLRLGWPAITEFKADEARLLALSLDMAGFKSFPLRGIGSSVGLPNFPISVWLYALPLFVWKHPYAATLFVAALNTAAVYVCYRLTRRYWGEAAALTAALLFAASPWAVIYSRKIWAQDLLPLFVLGYVGSALKAFVDGRGRFLALHIVLLAAIVQIHLSGVALLPLTALLLIVFWRRALEEKKALAIGAGAALLTLVPFGIWVLRQSGGGGLGPLADLLARPAVFSSDSIRFTWMVLTGADIHSLAGPLSFRAYLDSVPNIDLVRWLWGMLVLGGLALALYRRRPADLILAAWLVVPVLFFVRHSTPVFPHYFILVLPAGYMLAGVMVQTLVEQAGQRPGLNARAAGVAAGGLVAVTALAQAAVWLALLFFVGTHDTSGGFGMPLGRLLQAAEAGRRAMAARPAPEILVVGEGDDPAVDEFPAVMDVLLRDLAHRFVDGNEAAVIPEAGAVVLLAPGDFTARRWYAGCAMMATCRPLSGAEVASAPESGRPYEVDLVEVPAGIEIEIANPIAEPRLLANGVELLGWEASPVWTVIWRVGHVPPAADYHFFNHAPGDQADGVGYASRHWRDGDRVISFFELDSGGGPVRVGMYEYPAVVNVPVMDALGNPHSDAVTAQP